MVFLWFVVVGLEVKVNIFPVIRDLMVLSLELGGLLGLLGNRGNRDNRDRLDSRQGFKEAAGKASVVGNRETRPQHTRCLYDSHVAAVEDPYEGGSEAPNKGLISGGNCPAQVVKGAVPLHVCFLLESLVLFHKLMAQQVGFAQGTHIVEQFEVIFSVGGYEHGLGLLEITEVSNFNVAVLKDLADLEMSLGRAQESDNNVVPWQASVVDQFDEVSGSFWKSSVEEGLGEALWRDVVEAELPATVVPLMVLAGSGELAKSTHVRGLKGVGSHFCGSFESQSRVGWLLRSGSPRRRPSILPVSVFWSDFFKVWKTLGDGNGWDFAVLECFFTLLELLRPG